MRPPHKVSENEVDIYGKRLNHKYLTLKCLNEEVIALSINKIFLEPLPGYEFDEGLCMISCKILNSMRPSCFNHIEDINQPWLEDKVILPPSCIINSFLILDVEKPYEELDYVEYQPIKHQENTDNHLLTTTTTSILPTRNIISSSSSLYKNHLKIKPIDTIHVLCDYFSDVRNKANKNNLIPLYHYTSLHAAMIIMKKGIKLNSIETNYHHDIGNIFNHINGFNSNNGGGIYFTTKSPASYHVGSKQYEINLLKDLYNVENVNKYKGNKKCDVVIVYGCCADVLEQVIKYISLYYISLIYIYAYIRKSFFNIFLS